MTVFPPSARGAVAQAGAGDVAALRTGLAERGGPGARRARWLPRSVTTRSVPPRG